jgi:hypothetical protein
VAPHKIGGGKEKMAKRKKAKRERAGYRTGEKRYGKGISSRRTKAKKSSTQH